MRIFFTKESVEKIRAGKKTATTRVKPLKKGVYDVWEGTRWRGKKTDLKIEIKEIELIFLNNDGFKKLNLISLMRYNEEIYTKEGFETFQDYFNEVKRLNPKLEVNDLIHIHFFKLV